MAEPDTVPELFEQLELLSAENRSNRQLMIDRRIMELRQLLGTALTREPDAGTELVEPDFDSLPAGADLPEVSPDELTPALVRAAILRHGAILVRGLVDPDDATELAEGIDHAYAVRDSLPTTPMGKADEEGHYQEFHPKPPNGPLLERRFIEESGGLLAADSPRLAFEMIELLEQAEMRNLATGYLRETPALSAHKTTLRKAVGSTPTWWHQDGKFLGDVKSVNLWLSLSHCGDDAPGMDLVPRRLERIVEAGMGSHGAEKIMVSQELAEELAGEAGIVRPIFEPGDAMFFDHLYLHRTATEPGMPNPRFAVESWFFGPSAFPEGYIPLAY